MVESVISEADLSDETIIIGKFSLNQKLWWKKLLRIAEIATIQKRYQSKIIMVQFEDLIKNCVKISYPYLNTFREISRQRAARSGWAGLGFKLYS